MFGGGLGYRLAGEDDDIEILDSRAKVIDRTLWGPRCETRMKILKGLRR